MLVKMLLVAVGLFVLLGVLNPTNSFAGEVQKTPLTSEEISILKQHSGGQIQALLKGDAIAIEKFAAEKGIDAEKLKEALASFSDVERQALLAVTPEELDAIIAGEMSGADILLAALAAVGLLVLVALLAA
jgi:hypothetical protein